MIKMIWMDFHPDSDFRCAWGKLPIEFVREGFSRRDSCVKKFLPFAIVEARVPTNSAFLLTPR